MDLNELKTRIKNGELSGFYIFAGEEDYLKKYYLRALREAIVTDETFAPFNHVVFDGVEINFDRVREAIESPPMMSDYKLIEWKYASLDTQREDEKAALEALFTLKEEYPSSVFAILATADGFDVGTQKKPSKNYTRLSKGFDIITFNKSTDAQLIGWLKKHFESEGIQADPQTLSAMIFRVGHSMEVLNNEVVKLSSYLKSHGLSKVTVKEIEEVTSSTIECDAFALSNAITEKNLEKAFTALSDLKQRRIDAPAIIAMLERTYCELMSVALLLEEGRGSADIEAILKMHSYKVKLAIASAKKLTAKKIAASLDSLRRIDAASKSGGSAGYGIVEAFIIQNI